MAGLVTRETDRSVIAHIDSLNSTNKKEDAPTLLLLIQDTTGLKPKICGNEKVPDFLIGFGSYSYQRKGSKEILKWFKVGFAPRKSKITIYLTIDLDAHESLIEKLGKCKHGRGCLYLNKLSDIDIDMLRKLIVLNAQSKDFA